MRNHAVIESDGCYGAIDAAGGTICLTMTNPSGATVTVQASHDGGETWNDHHAILPTEYRRQAEYVRPYCISKPTRMRLVVTGFTRQFKYWLEQTR